MMSMLFIRENKYWNIFKLLSFIKIIQLFMKTQLFILLAIVALQVASIPFKEQIALVNSLQVGRDQDPMTWTCVGCDQTNKPIRSHIIKEDSKDIKAILSVYQQYTVLAFRYTATIKNVWQDILWAFQVQDQKAPSGCKVQKQYDNMWNSIRGPTYADLIASSHTKRLIITGISLGGGLAAISFVDIQHLGVFDSIEVITFGSPRVGNKQWAQWLETQVVPVHICIKGDPICVLPRCLTPICNYKHSGIGFSCNKKTQQCTSKGKKDFEWENQDYSELISNVIQHYAEEDNEEEQVNGIIDHITGYKKIINYSWVQ